MPGALQKMMREQQRALLEGMLDPGTAEDGPEHWQHPEGRYGAAASRAESEARDLVAAVDAHRPLSEIVRRFGALAHWISDLNDPLHAGDRDPALARYYADYESYLEEQLQRFPLVFEGYRSPRLGPRGPRDYLLAAAARSRDYAAAVRRAYTADGRRASAQAFDERSLAFGVGSLAYSHAVNDVVRVWLWAWEACHGDTSGTPYVLEPLASAPEPGVGAAGARGIEAP